MKKQSLMVSVEAFFYSLLTVLNTFIVNEFKVCLFSVRTTCIIHLWMFSPIILHFIHSISMYSNYSTLSCVSFFKLQFLNMVKPTSTLVTVLCTVLFDPLCILGVCTDSLTVVCTVIDGVVATSSWKKKWMSWRLTLLFYITSMIKEKPHSR